MSEEKKTKKQGENTEKTASKGANSRTTSEKKKTTSEASSEEKKTSSRQKKTTAKPLEAPKQEEKEPNPSSVGNQLVMMLLIVMSVFIGICYAFRDDVGVIGYAIAFCLFGLFGFAAFLVPFLLLQMALFWRRDVVNGAVKYKYIVAIFVLLFFSVMVHTIYGIATDLPKLGLTEAYSWDNIKGFFTDGTSGKGGGFFGGLIASALICAVGYPGTILFGSLFLIGFLMALFGLTPMECVQRYRFYKARSKSADAYRKEKQKETKEARDAEKEKAPPREKTKSKTAQTAEKTKKNREEPRHAEQIDPDIFEDDATFGKEEAAPKKPVQKQKSTVKQEELRPIVIVSGDDEKTEAEVELAWEAPKLDEPSPASDSANISEEESDMRHFVPVKRTKTEPKSRSALTAETVPPYEPIKKEEKAAPAPITVRPPEKSTPAKADAVSDVIAIRPPEMSVPAPDIEGEEEEIVVKPREYEFPPIDLLAKPSHQNGDGDVSAELRENADRIIETLESFNVRVNISNVSRGPTITRYELEPAPGTRVRSILNLLDDIALSLATSGVRSDGIISGKSAIGIEVPNKVTNTVYARELIEDSRFESAKSKLTASLGMDVSGAPVYLDIAKMPHLLIAGATGQGKSVCINSIIISLLYKARPDEVKLILIDPKKVELNVYNGLPHLLVPVVFDPKKAAGSLHWAVQEMERRFELIEAQHVRNIAQYNNAIADDPLKEKLPQVVIIIDELADLMMSAPDDVETSICRLAQKARAAGMHLIIGTQRPSTDVITGLIKANIPSRIAFTVSNQIDSRIIIDTQGAEKLIGRGDMLFSPVGSSKPVRVQGAFVSETEIEDIIDFIKAQSEESSYSDEVMQEIEKNAAACGQKKGKMTASSEQGNAVIADGEEEDPMLGDAIELALESGKISTSLIQRRLSLGYGRAAKLIDVMEKRGIVSPPEGQKPRTVLLTREQYMEMKMGQADSANSADELPFDIE